MAIPCGAEVIYVDADANGANDGPSWANAYNYLQDALVDANSNPDVNEIRVAQGTYKPDQNSADPNGSDDRTATFQLINGMGLKGGYAGFGEPDPNDRDVELYETVLSGDLNSNDAEVANPADMWLEPSRAENSYHVVTGSGTDASAVLDGFTITAGHAEGDDPNNDGGGMLNWTGSPSVLNCTFSRNSAEHHGGGMCNRFGSNPTVINCAFIANLAWRGGGMRTIFESNPRLINCTFIGNIAHDGGGGLCNLENSNPELEDCTFSGNEARSRWGGGIFNEHNSNPTLGNCAFHRNWAGSDGGGMCNRRDSDPILTNCTFIGNGTDDRGGGIYNYKSSPTLGNCTFHGNWAVTAGGGIYNDSNSNPILTNCILWGNTAEMNGNEIAIYSAEHPSMPTILYSDVEGSWLGEGNIDEDPLFVDLGHWDEGDPNNIFDDVWVDGDYHLKSQGWYWHAGRKVWTWDEDETSRCIDAGNPGSPLGEELLTIPEDPPNDFGQNLRINMGAYGGTTEASMPPYDWALLSDMTNDGTVDFVDFAHLADIYLEQDEQLPADFDRDGDVDKADLRLLTEDWLKQTSWHE